MSQDQANSWECRECGEIFTEESGASENFACEQCTEQLLEESNRYTKEQIINSIHTKDIEIEELWKQEITKHFEECKEICWLDMGHTSEDFREFVINQFWYTIGIDPSDFDIMTIDQLREIMITQ